MLWWIWIVLGIALVCAEIFTPLNFYLVFIGLGFLVTGALVGAEVVAEPWIQWASTGVFSALFYIGLKSKLSKFSSNATDRKEDYIGEGVTVKSDIGVGETGSGELRGTSWRVKNNSAAVLRSGSSHQVSKVDGIVLIVE